MTSIELTYIEQTEELIFGTIDGDTYGTSFLAIQEGAPDEDNVYPH